MTSAGTPPDHHHGHALATRAVSSDHSYSGREVAPNISLTTTFRHLPPPLMKDATKWNAHDPQGEDVYSRYTTPTLTRAEKVLEAIIGYPTILLPSGIAAVFAALVMVRPDVIAMTPVGVGYHGCHEAVLIYKRLRGEGNVRMISLDDDYAMKGTEKKLLCWLETPLNPTGECTSIEAYAKKAHAAGGVLAIDSTFAPPPMSDPFKWGADIVMHSATKYFAGHSDALAGSLSVRTEAEWQQLWHNRTYTGCNIGSLDAWLVLRGARTLDIRVKQQSATATALAYWLNTLARSAPNTSLDGPSDFVHHVYHASLQDNSRFVGPGKQMEIGPATFAILCSTPFQAAWLPHSLELWTPATSLGGVESLMEHRIVSDPLSDPRLVRLSVGVESFEDLKKDLIRGMQKVLAREQGGVIKL